MEINFTKRLFIKRITCLLPVVFVFSLSSCKRNPVNMNAVEGAVVKVNINNTLFENSVEIDKKAASSSTKEETIPEVQRNTVALNEDFQLNAELSLASNSQNNTKKAASTKKAATLITTVDPDIWYSVAIFDNTGKYLNSRTYQYGKESSTAPLLLDGGMEYTFIAYSVGTKVQSDLPVLQFSDSNKTLSNASITLANNSKDIMYYKTRMPVSGSVVNYLSITFRHLVSQIITTIDASATGYLITDLNSQFLPHYNNATISIADGTMSYPAPSVNYTLNASGLNSQVWTSPPSFVNANTVNNNNGSYVINSITVGPLNKTNITPFSDLSFLPGVSYNLKLTIVPTDGYLDYQGQKAVRINGKIWMRLNLGATATNLDASTIDQTFHGNYYQWGRSTIVGNGTATIGNSSWDGSNNPVINAWNSGTESFPGKTSNDPCPSGYRIPTEKEASQLIEDATPSVIGPQEQSLTNYGSAFVYTSKRNSNVKIVIPEQGRIVATGNNYPYTKQNVAGRGTIAFFHTSLMRVKAGNQISVWNGLLIGGVAKSAIWQLGSNNANTVVGYPIRCIAQ